MKNKSASRFLPLTHTTYYTLIALENPLHGYGIMQTVDDISGGQVKLGSGTLYGALSKLEKQGIINKFDNKDTDRRKLYILTELGKEVVKLEFERLKQLVEVSEVYINRIGGPK